MRRALGTLLLTISLFVGAMAWSGFLILNTALDPDRSERVATNLLDDPDVRSQIAANIARTVDANIPPEAGLPPSAAADAADAALDSPAVQALVFDALVATHRAMLGEGEPPSHLDGGAFGAAARDALVAQHPELDGVLPAAPHLEIALPTDRIPDLGGVRDLLRTAVPVLALVALIGAVLALVVTSNRPAVLRRTGIWAIGLSIAGIAFAYGIPALASRFLPDQSAIIAAIIGAMAEKTAVPAVAMAVAGLGAIGVSMVWKPAAGAIASRPEHAGPRPVPRTGALKGERARRQAASGLQRGVDLPRSRPPRPGGPPPSGAPPSRTGRPRTPPFGVPATGPPLAPAAGHQPRARPLTPDDATRVEAVGGAGARTRPGARWVEDVGWVHQGDGPIPDGARFVPGAGYVLPD